MRITLVLDLDHTLIHAKSPAYDVNMSNVPEKAFTVACGRYSYDIWTRPYADVILPLLSKFTNLYLFTCATREYTMEILRSAGWDIYFLDIFTRGSYNGAKDVVLATGDDNAVLVDDRFSNNVPGQRIYHIPRFKNINILDYELPKLLMEVLKWSAFGLP